MMKKILSYLGMVICAALLTCCDDAIYQGDSGKGKIALQLDINTSIVSSGEGQGSRSVSNPTVDDLTVCITPTDQSHAPYVYSYPQFIASDLSFPIGEYLLEVYCGNAEEEGFETPHYYGSCIFTIKTDRTTEVAITASMSKSMFTIKYSDDVKLYLRSYSAQLQSEGHSPVSYLGNETRPAYLMSGNVSIYIDIEKPSGAASRIKVAEVNAEKAHHYKINVELGEPEATAGEGALVINFDEMLQREDVTIDLGDELINSAPPIVSCVGFDADEAIDHMMGLKVSNPYQFQMTAGAGFAELNLITENASAVCGGTWPESINLVGLDASKQQALKDMGLNVTGLWSAVPSQMAIVDLSGVVENLKQPADGSPVKFSIGVVDAHGKTNKIDATHPSPTLAVNVVKPIITLDNPQALPSGQGTATFDLSYNGNDPTVLGFSVNDANASAAFTPAGTGKWTVTMDVDFTKEDIIVAASNGAKYADQRVSSSLAIARCDAAYGSFEAVPEADVWATKVLMTKPDGISRPVFLMGLDNDCKRFETTPVTPEGSKYAISNLSDNKTHYVLVVDQDDHSKAGICYVFNTEKAIQLYNGNMEKWYEAKKFSNSSLWVPGESGEETIWGTYNELTCKEGTERAYQTTSGTMPTSDAAYGSKAALIRTVGWGKLNTAAGSISAVYHVTQGELYLGKWNGNAPDYGIAFASRPAELSFKAKYTPKNSADKGYAEITVLNAAGTVIATASKDIDSSSSYSLFELPLSYSVSAKAATLIVKFISTNAGDTFLTQDNLNCGSVSRAAEHVGSQLYVDEIKLKY